MDFGSYAEVKSRYTEDNSIGFSISVSEAEARSLARIPRIEILLKNFQKLELEVFLELVGEGTIVRKFCIALEKDSASISLDNEGFVESFMFNDIDISAYFLRDEIKFDNKSLVPSLLTNVSSETKTKEPVWQNLYFQPVGAAVREIKKMYRTWLHGSFSDQTINQLVRRLSFNKSKNFLNLISGSTGSYASWNDFVRILENSKSLRERLRSLYFFSSLSSYLIILEQILTGIFANLSYIGPSRATGERYYRKQELAVDSIDAKGENLAMFLNSLNRYDQNSFAEWVSSFIGYEVRPQSHVGHVSIILERKDEGHQFNLADVGYGFSQVLPIMAQIWTQIRFSRAGAFSLIVLEQPELHLHPAYQAVIADALAWAVTTARNSLEDKQVSIVMETHSQALINRLGELIQAGSLNSSDVSIFISELSP